MATQSQPATEPERRSYWDEVVIPFGFLDPSKIEQLDLFPGRPAYRATGEYPDRGEPRPYDPFTAWVTMAHLGLIEKDEPLPGLNPELDRDERLVEACKLLSTDELLIVESIAVPKRFREMSAEALVTMVRTAPDYIDRMWAACWLTLVGWTESTECTFRDSSEMPQRMGDELRETVIEARGENIADSGPEVTLIGRRLNICAKHYWLNGPPPYELMKDTVPLGPGWEQIVRIVPKRVPVQGGGW
jgi:hypothetical protein